jgi:histidinol-phosphate aminotransferase
MIVDKVAVLALVERFPDTYFLLDEAYFEFSGQTFATEIPNHPNLLVTRSFSKAFSLAGLRLGYVLASEQIIQALALVRNTKQVSYFASQFGPMVLERVDKVMAHVERVRANRASFRKVATAGGRFHIPESQANFLLFQFPTVEERAIIIDRLAQLKAQVRVVGSGLLKKNLLRVSIIGSFEMGPISEIFR